MPAIEPAHDPAPDELRVVAVVGNPRPHSRTAAATTALVRSLAEHLGAAEPEVVDLAPLGSDLLGLAGPSAARTAELVTSADVVVVGTPVYKGTYTGLLKLFLDQLPGGALDHAVATVVSVAKAPEHRLGADAGLRPVLAELGASLPAPSLLLLESELDEVNRRTNAWTQRQAGLVAATATRLNAAAEVPA